MAIRPMTQDERERAMERDKINSSQDALRRERDALAKENERLRQENERMKTELAGHAALRGGW